MLDCKGNINYDDWTEKTKRWKYYDPPIDWIGYGLKIYGNYENNDLLGMNLIYGEWCVAYHEVTRNESPKKVSKITGNIYKINFKFQLGENVLMKKI